MFKNTFKRMSPLLCLLPLICSAKNKDGVFLDLTREQRRIQALETKSQVANFDVDHSVKTQHLNGDEERYDNLVGSFGVALQHYSNGFIVPFSFERLVKAVQSQKPSDFDQIPLGAGVTKLVNPQGAFDFSLNANDAWVHPQRAAPAFASAERAADTVEVYCDALTRDVLFENFNSDATVALAVADLNALSAFTGPKIGGVVTPDTYLRGSFSGCLDGPYVSQFLLRSSPISSTNTLGPGVTTPVAGSNFLKTFTTWFAVTNGGAPLEPAPATAAHGFIRNTRDLAEYVHTDAPGQIGLFAAYILNSFGGAFRDPANPYFNDPTQAGFVTFAITDFVAKVVKASEESLKACWYTKWIQRILRPQEMGFYVWDTLTNGANLGINPELLNSNVLPQSMAAFGSIFLTSAYREGAPAHPSYPAGHSTYAGAMITILKAFFNENLPFPNPVMPSGGVLVPYTGSATLTIGGELNKLAHNIGMGRVGAGIHYRSDNEEGLLLGEKVAIDILNNEGFLFNENFKGFSLTKFNGETITVGKKR